MFQELLFYSCELLPNEYKIDKSYGYEVLPQKGAKQGYKIALFWRVAKF